VAGITTFGPGFRHTHSVDSDCEKSMPLFASWLAHPFRNKMEHDEKIRLAERLHSYVRDWRGRILNTVAVIERNIALLISSYFCREEKKYFFFSEIATSHFFSFGSKINILKKILKKDYQFCLDQNPDFFREIERVMEFRNLIAHAPIDISDEALERDPKEGVGFVSYSDGVKSIKVFSEADFNEMSGIMGNVTSELATLMRFVIVEDPNGIPNQALDPTSGAAPNP
jgi:hypothetical protein